MSSSVRTVFKRVSRTFHKSGKCRVCGRRVVRYKTFGQTVNPFNRNAEDGSVKTVVEIQRELADQGQSWVKDKDMAHARCEVEERITAAREGRE